MFGETKARHVAQRIATACVAISDLQAIDSDNRFDGMICALADGSKWKFNATSTAVDATSNLVVTPSVGSGVWLRQDSLVALSLPYTFATADAAALFTVPVGARLHPIDSWWDTIADHTGGSSSAIGLSTSVTGFNTKGDLLGGASGDVAATLVAANVRQTGTIGAKMATRTLGRLVLIAADVIRYDRITSVFTAGSGTARVLCAVLANPGA